MSTREDGPASPLIERKDQLIAHLEAGCKPSGNWRIGTEHEKFGFHTTDLSPLPYAGENGVRALLEQMIGRYGWVPIMEGDDIIALKMPDDPLKGNISLEPGGQFELSGGPLETVHQTCAEVNGHRAQVEAIGTDLGIGFLGLGFSPKWTLAETPMMPKGRYNIMKAYMPRVGGLGLNMMFRSCTIQVNLDFGSETDMVKKLRVSLALQPIATALFANSPFTEGKPNGFISYRSEVWKDTDPDRTGMLPFVFEDGMSFERYVDYALDVPMYFLFRNGTYLDVSGHSFRDFMAGKLDALPGELPHEDDWADHLSTIFPEVRMKKFLEMRGADGGPWQRICSLPAFWVGLLYDDAALEAAWSLVKDWTDEERQTLRDQVPVHGLRTPFRGGSVHDVARNVLAISADGLKARGQTDSLGSDERMYLDDLERIVEDGQTSADVLLDHYANVWGGDIAPVFEESAF
ncbi:MAG: glutamate--cysteine ligase [Hyphomicrobiaceae bacterium]